ncbi:hypothetical protein F7731_15875 [Cytobacillus depressus]|uniref:Amidohydrolase n=1 Tax=Cytobacillus depressus TaxID=1602942 RepID=A0A6L3V4H1_9BACI|nr:hypothetical protein [Cytobacillus depressus]KAB2333332.1 hypothetical protein F7731_15875 [Cytobacillus depressus]
MPTEIEQSRRRYDRKVPKTFASLRFRYYRYTYPAWMASEPFNYYQKYFPGVFAFVGIENKKKGTGAEHHNPRFDIAEDVLKLGVAATIQYTLDFLSYENEIDFSPEEKELRKLMNF